MTLAERLKSLRKTAGLSQEALAEKLGVSRQAITKWETEAGTPDIANLMALSALFGISVDELLGGEKAPSRAADFLFESVTEYDIDRSKRYEFKLGGAKKLSLCACEGEKLRVVLASNQLSSLESDVKLKIDDVRERIDIDLSRKNGLTEAQTKEALYISVFVPQKYIYHIEVAANAADVEVSHLRCDEIELNVKASSLCLNDVEGTVEVNCNLDMEIECLSLRGSLEINQVSATSRLALPADFAFRALVKGLGNSVRYEKAGLLTDDFSDESAENIVELNGMKSELVITRREEAKR